MAFSAVCAAAVTFASACSSDAPIGPEPVLNDPSLAVLQSDVVTPIRSRLAPTKCLTVKSATASSIVKGNRAELQPCDGRTTQQFLVTTAGRISIGNNFCLDAANATGKDGDSVIVWTCHGGTNQLWNLTDVSEIRGVNTKCVDVANADPRDGQAIILWSCHGGSNQKWDLGTSSAPTPAPVTSVKVTLPDSSLTVGDVVQATATLRDAAGNVLTGRAVSWTSNSSTVASVTAAGLVTALASGQATITATSEAASSSVTVTVAAPPVTQPPPDGGGGSCSLVADWNVRPTSALAKPGYLQTVLEPDFGTRLTRITGDPGTAIAGGLGTWGQLAGNAYAKEPVWNADGSLLVLRVMDTSGGWLFLDGNTYQPLFRRGGPGGWGHLWHPAEPDIMVFSNPDGDVGRWNVRTNAVSYVYQTSAYNNASFGEGEGNVSASGRYVAVLATRNADSRRVAFVVDLTNGTRGPELDLAAQGMTNVDWLSVSQGGEYVVAVGVVDGTSQRVKAWSRATLAQTAYWPADRMGHFDLGVDAAGREVAFGGAAAGSYPTRFVALDLGSGAVRPLSPATTWNWHASTRNTKRPGWGYAVTNDRTSFALSGEIYAVKLDGSQGVQRFGRHRSNNTDYEAAAFAVPSPDGKRVAFRSNWGASSGRPVQTYVLDARQLCP